MHSINERRPVVAAAEGDRLSRHCQSDTMGNNIDCYENAGSEETSKLINVADMSATTASIAVLQVV